MEPVHSEYKLCANNDWTINIVIFGGDNELVEEGMIYRLTSKVLHYFYWFSMVRLTYKIAQN